MAIKVGIAPDSWGVWFPDHEKQPKWTQTMDEMNTSGFAGFELGPWGYFPTDFSTLNSAASSRDLEVVAGTVGADFLDDESVDGMLKTIDEIAETLKGFPSAKYIVLLPSMYTDLETGEEVMNPVLTDAEFDKYAKNVQRAADYVKSKGFVATFHPHVDSHIQTEEEIEHLLDSTDVMLCLDTGHHVYGGGEPISFYKKHVDRIPYIHIKDCDLDVKATMDENSWSFAKAVTEDIMVAPGNGSIDFAKLYQALQDTNYDGWVVVEQDLFPVKSFDIPLEQATIARTNLKNAGFN